MPFKDPEIRKLYDRVRSKSPERRLLYKKWRKSPSGIAYEKKRAESDKYKEYNKMWRQSPSGKLHMRLQEDKPERKAYKKIYNALPRVKEAKNRYNVSTERRKNVYEWQDKNFESWLHIIKSPTNCEVCGKDIFLNPKDNTKSIHFDHRRGKEEPIKTRPNTWLRSRWATVENVEIWKSCHFGTLCNKCNIMIPTLGRIEWLTKALKYARKEY